MADLIRKVDEVAAANRSSRVTAVAVRVGALSHLTVDGFRARFAEAAVGTVAEGAEVDVALDADIADPRARDVTLESIELETSDPVEDRF